MSYLGIDVGTGGTRALVIDAQGKVVASASAEHENFASPRPGWAEQHPQDWWRACGLAVRHALQSSGLQAGDITCVGFSGQMHGAVLLDSAEEVVRPAIIWCDQRSEAQSRELEEMFGRDTLIRLTCNPPLTNFTLTKLLWVRETEPANWARVAHVMLPKDYVRFRLTGERAIDMADASGTLLLDVTNRRWSAEVLAKTGIDQKLLPALFESPQVCGNVSAAGAEATGLRAGTPVVAGAGDQAAGAVGMGIARAGAVSATIGTSGVVFASTDRPALDPQGRLHTFCHAIPGPLARHGGDPGCGTLAALVSRSIRRSISRIAKSEYKKDGRDPYDVFAEEASCRACRLRRSFLGSVCRWRTHGASRSQRPRRISRPHCSHTRAHVIRAIMEGVAFSLKDSFTIFDEMKIPVTSIRLGGGGARSPLWRQIQADVYAHEVEIVAAEEGAAYGAAILAGTGPGAWSSVEKACDGIVQVAKHIGSESERFGHHAGRV